MHIRAGFEIEFDLPAPTPMLLALSVHPERWGDLECPERLRVAPCAPATRYRDSFGNLCTRLVAPAGRLQLAADVVVRDSGAPDLSGLDAPQAPVEALPDETLLPDRQPLLRDRPTGGPGLAAVRRDRRRRAAGRGDRRLRPSADRLRLQRRARHPHRLRGARGEAWSLPRLRAPGDRSLPLPEHSGALLHRLSGRHRRRALALSRRFQRLVRGLSRRALAGVRRAPRHPPHRPHPDRPRPGCGGHGHLRRLRPGPVGRLQGLYGRGGAWRAVGAARPVEPDAKSWRSR